MFLQELANYLKDYATKHPEMADKDIYRMQLDLAAEVDTIKIVDNKGQLEISNWFLNPYSK